MSRDTSDEQWEEVSILSASSRRGRSTRLTQVLQSRDSRQADRVRSQG
jgi:hypothetical protein